MTAKKLPLPLENTSVKLYGSLGERVASGLLDGVFLAPVTIGVLFFNSLHLYNYYYTFVVTQLIIAAYCIYLPVRYGATPGKRAMGLTILTIDGSAIAYREAFLKYLPMLVIGLFAFVIQAWTIGLADEAKYNSLSWMEQSKYLQSVSQFPLWIEMVVIYVYYIATLLMVIIDKRNRSVSDRLAGTVVIHTRALEEIAELDSWFNTEQKG